jgi:hypothetical protein
MPFDLAGAHLLPSARACRAVVWAQAALAILGGAFVVLTAVLFGSSAAILFHGGALSNGGAVLLGGVSICTGAALFWLGMALDRPLYWVPATLVSVEVFLAILTVIQAFDLSFGTVLNLALCVTAVALLAAPGTRRAPSGDRAA